MQIYSVPIDLPKYRLENGRTAAAQIEYLAKHPKIETDVFTKDPEFDTAQEIQHGLLKEMVNEGGLFDYFKEKDQEMPLILSNRGFVVNGNRRLCALRELKKVEYIDVVVLPPADEREIDWLEGKEQIHRDITARYSWYATAIMYRRRLEEHHVTTEQLAQIYEVDEDDISDLLDLLSYGEMYLKDRKKEGQFSELDHAEFALRQLKKHRPKLKTEANKDIYTQLCYILIDKRMPGDRAYQTVADVAKYFGPIVSAIREDFFVSEKDEAVKTTLLGEEMGAPLGVLKAVKDATNHEAICTIIREIIDSERARDKDTKKANYVLSQLKRASTMLLDTYGAINSETTQDGVADQLTEIETTLSRFRKWLDA